MQGQEELREKTTPVDPKDDSKKTGKKLIQLESDKTRGIVNLFYVESYKKYNAMDVEEIQNNNAICRCNIFWTS